MAAAASDLRSFNDVLRQEGDLADIVAEVDPELEVGTITRNALEARDRAPYFNNVKGSPDGLFRILGGAGGLRPHGPDELGRIALHVGLPSSATPRELVDRSMAIWRAGAIPPRIVSTGRCKENKILAADINLLDLPVLLLHKGDDGKYIQTLGLNCVKSPDGS